MTPVLEEGIGSHDQNQGDADTPNQSMQNSDLISNNSPYLVRFCG